MQTQNAGREEALGACEESQRPQNAVGWTQPLRLFASIMSIEISQIAMLIEDLGIAQQLSRDVTHST